MCVCARARACVQYLVCISRVSTEMSSSKFVSKLLHFHVLFTQKLYKKMQAFFAKMKCMLVQ